MSWSAGMLLGMTPRCSVPRRRLQLVSETLLELATSAIAEPIGPKRSARCRPSYGKC
jgi:hypothetical protein